jgi:hypothetical protein
VSYWRSGEIADGSAQGGWGRGETTNPRSLAAIGFDPEFSKINKSYGETIPMLLFLQICAALSVVILVVGLIKPKWILFFMKQPDRLSVTALAMLIFMASWTGIAKMTLKPKERVAAERSSEDANRLQLER